MAMEIRVLMSIIVAVLLWLAPLSSSISGDATSYAPHSPSDCKGVKATGQMVAAVSDALWAKGGTCGKKFNVTCIGPPSFGQGPPCGGSIDVTVVDRCPSPCPATFQLSEPAFSKITNPNLRLQKIIIDYKPAV